ncbi:MAG TPA: hypothetical protein VEP89_05920 [Draconibacterium sp.]|nr:hypothetical protein [Draconibacterium sp.]
MRKVICRIVGIILLPIVLIAVVNYTIDPDFVLKTGYTKQIAMALNEGKMVAGPVNSNLRQIKKKWIEIMDEGPDILVLGSSRTISLSNNVFHGEHFFNASVSNCTFQDMYIFISLLEQQHFKYPEKVFICCDLWLFGNSFSEKRWLQNRSDFISLAEQSTTIPLKNIPPKWEIQKEWITELFSTRYLLRSVKTKGKKQEITICEKVDSTQMMLLPDGTRLSPARVTNINEVKTEELARHYFYNTDDEHFATIDPTQKILFDQLLILLKKKGSKPILYIPPYHPTTYELIKNEDQTKGIFQANDYVGLVAQQNNIKVVGAINPFDSGLQKSDFYDGVHLKKAALEQLFVKELNE